MKNALLALASACLAAAALPAQAAGRGADEGAPQWSNWRGPNHNGSIEVGELPSDGLVGAVAWEAPLLGQGAGTPIVSGEHVFLTAFDHESKKLFAVALDRDSGEILWEQECGRGQRPGRSSRGRENTFAAGSPATDGERVFFLFGSGDFVAFDYGGEELWRRQLVEEYGRFVINWGYAASPLCFAGTLYVPILHRGKSRLLGVDPATGKNTFDHVRPNEAVAESQEAYTTPVPFLNGERQEILVLGGDCLSSHDPQTGDELWRWCGINPRKAPNFRQVSSAVVGEGGMIFVTTPQHGPLHALRVEGDQVEQVWELRRPTPDSTTPLYYRGKLWSVDGRNQRMVCLEPATGEVVWQADLDTETFIRASPTGSDGKIYVMGAQGTLLVIEAADEFRQLSRTAFDSYPSRSSIVASDGQLLIRTAERLFCIGGAQEDA